MVSNLNKGRGAKLRIKTSPDVFFLTHFNSTGIVTGIEYSQIG